MPIYAIIVLLALILFVLVRTERNPMVNTDKLTGAINALATAVAALAANNQAKVDAATAQVETITTSLNPQPPQ